MEVLFSRMSKNTKAKTDEQLAHMSSRSKTHKRHKLQGDLRRQHRFLRVAAAERPSPKRNFGGLEGFELILKPDGAWHRCDDPEELIQYLKKEKRRRLKYEKWTTRHGKPELAKRTVQRPIDILTTSLHPAASDVLAADVAGGRDIRPTLRAIFGPFLQAARALLEKQRYVLAAAMHMNTDDLHMDIAVAKNCPIKGRIGRTGLLTVGPWCVAVDRQIRCGARINPTKQNRYQRSVANYRRRYGNDAKPLDITLARLLDDCALRVMGARLEASLQAYAQGVPELERKHAECDAAELEQARAIVLGSVEQDNRLDAPDGPSLR